MLCDIKVELPSAHMLPMHSIHKGGKRSWKKKRVVGIRGDFHNSPDNYPFFFFNLIYFILFYLSLQYCIGFAIYQNESATGVQVFPIRNPPPSSLPYWMLGAGALITNLLSL